MSLLTAADTYARLGRAEGDYYDQQAAAKGTPPADCPVCALGAIAIDHGLRPDIWEFGYRDLLDTAEMERFARALADVVTLADHLGIDLDPDNVGEVIEVIGSWHDTADADEVLAAMRAAGAESESEAHHG